MEHPAQGDVAEVKAQHPQRAGQSTGLDGTGVQSLERTGRTQRWLTFLEG